MKYPTRIYYTEADKGLMWDRWEKGEARPQCFSSYCGKYNPTLLNTPTL